MLRLIWNRVIQMIWVLLLLSAATFVLMKLAPGDPVLSILHTDEVAVTEADKAALRHELGLDLPMYQQFGRWVLQVMKLDMGHSLITGKSVWDEMMLRLPITLELTLGGIIVMLGISIPLGILSAKYPGSWSDQISRILALAGASIPNFWLGLLLIHIFALKLSWLPSLGQGSLKQAILPSITLGFALSGVYARMIRAGLLDSLSQDYIRSIKARGLTDWHILLRYALKPALTPVLTIFGISMGQMLGGTVVVEAMFSWPGMGSMLMEAIRQRDFPLIQGYVLLSGFCMILVNLLVDLSYGFLNPRIRYAVKEVASS